VYENDDPNVTIQAITTAEDGQVNVGYSIGSGATVGEHCLYVSTPYGGSNCGSYMIGDFTPAIFKISPSSFQAGDSYHVTISGSNFGTACPAVTISGAGNSTFSVTTGTCSDTSVQGTATFDVAATGPSATVTLASNGFGSGFLPAQGQSNQGSATVQVAPVAQPTITGVSPSPFVAGQTYQSVSVTGTNFGVGTACPTSVSISGAEQSYIYVTAASCTPTAF
jgi:hypothetical protein